MFGIKIKKFRGKQVEVTGENLLNHLSDLQITEDSIHFQNRYNTPESRGKIKEDAKARKLIIDRMLQAFLILEEDIKNLTKGNNPENKKHFDKIKNSLLEIDKILKLQLDELNQKEILENNLLRTLSIDGMNPSGESKLTFQIRTLCDLIESQEKVIARYIVEIGNNITKEEMVSNQVDNRSEEIKRRFIISADGQTIYDTQTNLTWERDWEERGKMNWKDAIKINEDGFKLPSLENFESLNINKRESKTPLFNDLREIGFIIIDKLTSRNNDREPIYLTSTVEGEDRQGYSEVGPRLAGFYKGCNNSLEGESKDVQHYVVCVKQN